MTFVVEEQLKGFINQNAITITFPGGNAEGITKWVSDAPVFARIFDAHESFN
ncbi:MAG: hypothetical protein Q8O43_07135 [Dehalococcoidia bacterium]|nr:hypothetical protein [Dehalococcoidia bacterium]